MQFSQRAFMQGIGAKIPYAIAWFHRGGVVYLFARFPVKLSFLQAIVCDTLLDTLLDTPCGTLRGTLLETLDTLENYVKICPQTHTDETGERQAVYEYQIDVNVLHAIVDRVYLLEEMCSALTVIGADAFVSVRVLQQKMQMIGRAVSHRRAADVLAALEQEGFIKGNGLIRTRGREIVREHSHAD